MEKRPPSLQDREDVTDSRSGDRGHDSDGAGKRWQGFFPLQVEEPLCSQPLLELFERQLKRADTLGLDMLEHDLILAPRLIDSEPTAHDHVEPFLESKPEPYGVRSKEHSSNLAGTVLEGTVEMS